VGSALTLRMDRLTPSEAAELILRVVPGAGGASGAMPVRAPA
jgi:hypothetical protein